MAWNYRVIDHDTDEPAWFGLHEVFYDAKGNPRSVSRGLSVFSAEKLEELVGALRMALDDCQRHPILKESELERDLIDGQQYLDAT